ncbi:MAG: hypothetical protein Q9164_005183 [Protoblastenia rupestris]
MPLEVLTSIASYLPETLDVQNSRSLCRSLREAGNPFLIAKIWLSPHPADLEKLQMISTSPVFSQYVKEIAYDATVYESNLLDEREYLRVFGDGQFTVSYAHRPSRPARLEVSQAALLRGHAQYKAFYDRTPRFGLPAAFLSGRHLVDPKVQLPTDFSTLLLHIRSDYQSSECKPTWQLKDALRGCLPVDLIALLEALVRMPSVHTVGVYEDRWETHPYRAWTTLPDEPSRSFSIQYPMVQGYDSVVLDPRRVSMVGKGSWMTEVDDNRGFFLFASALSILECGRIHTFKVGHDGAVMDGNGISYDAFRMLFRQAENTKDMLRFVSRIHMNLRKSISWLDTGVLGLGEGLHAATNLTRLTLCYTTDDLRLPVVTPVFESQTWPKLSYIKLGYLLIFKDEIERFLQRHKSSLKTVFFDALGLQITEPGAEETGTRVIGGSWAEVYRGMSNMDLTTFCISNTMLDLEPDREQPHWSCDDPVANKRFLRSGGHTGFAANEDNLTPEEQENWLRLQAEKKG